MVNEQLPGPDLCLFARDTNIVIQGNCFQGAWGGQCAVVMWSQ